MWAAGETLYPHIQRTWQSGLGWRQIVSSIRGCWGLWILDTEAYKKTAKQQPDMVYLFLWLVIHVFWHGRLHLSKKCTDFPSYLLGLLGSTRIAAHFPLVPYNCSETGILRKPWYSSVFYWYEIGSNSQFTALEGRYQFLLSVFIQ